MLGTSNQENSIPCCNSENQQPASRAGPSMQNIPYAGVLVTSNVGFFSRDEIKNKLF